MRGKQAPKRPVVKDEIYDSEVVAKFINYVMLDGKKSHARLIVHQAIAQLSEKTNQKPIEALTQALENAKPKIEIRSRRVGGANYQVPTPVSPKRQEMLALRWIVNAARANRGKLASYEALARELIAAWGNEGNAVRKKEDVMRMADANKAFAQFSW